jgi:hypothetical protein
MRRERLVYKFLGIVTLHVLKPDKIRQWFDVYFPPPSLVRGSHFFFVCTAVLSNVVYKAFCSLPRRRDGHLGLLATSEFLLQIVLRLQEEPFQQRNLVLVAQVDAALLPLLAPNIRAKVGM